MVEEQRQEQKQTLIDPVEQKPGFDQTESQVAILGHPIHAMSVAFPIALTFATFGVYGDQVLPQNGMPFRITVPWKYGFKSPKFVVRVTFTETRPDATWRGARLG